METNPVANTNLQDVSSPEVVPAPVGGGAASQTDESTSSAGAAAGQADESSSSAKTSFIGPLGPHDTAPSRDEQDDADDDDDDDDDDAMMMARAAFAGLLISDTHTNN